MNQPPAIHAPAESVASNRLLAAIAAVETGNRDDAIGPHGEVSRYGIKPANWQLITDQPLSRASDPKFAHQVALAWLWALKYDLERDGVAVSPYTLALAWRFGPSSAVLRSFLPKSDKSYGVRVERLYSEPNARP